MSLIKSNGNKAMRTLLSDFFDTEKFFDDRFDNGGIPAVNVSDNEKEYNIEIAAPGMKKEDFKVNVESGVLNISAKREESEEEEGKNYTRREFSYNSFSRSFTLPENANQEDIRAKYENGLLKLTLAKKVPSAPKQKEVAVG